MDILAKSSGQAWEAVGDQTNWERGIENGNGDFNPKSNLLGRISV
jgi:hypothetical protein